jgi:hypothetical protein
MMYRKYRQFVGSRQDEVLQENCRQFCACGKKKKNHRDDCIHNVATTKINHEIGCHVFGIKVEFPFELIGIPK